MPESCTKAPVHLCTPFTFPYNVCNYHNMQEVCGATKRVFLFIGQDLCAQEQDPYLDLRLASDRNQQDFSLRHDRHHDEQFSTYRRIF